METTQRNHKQEMVQINYSVFKAGAPADLEVKEVDSLTTAVKGTRST